MGHCGTLDPMARGLLPILLGGATKYSAKFMECRKVYRLEVRFGFATNGDDREGAPIRWDNYGHVTIENLLPALDSFVGEFLQRPPLLCAKKIGGQAAHKLARSGKSFTLADKLVCVHAISAVRWSAPLLCAEIECGKGTYMRSIARDLGEKLHCSAHLHSLERLRCGGFSIGDAKKLSEFDAMAPDEILGLAVDVDAAFSRSI
jgi:tRNA pseudouridine55 synthase